MIELSPKTRNRIQAVFSASCHASVGALLLTDCGDNLPLVDKGHIELAERIRFAVLKLSAGDITRLQQHIDEAIIDWRDVLVSADFADDECAHLSWEPGEQQHDPLIWDAEMDVIAAHSYLANRTEFDSNRIAIVGASYSGEEMAEAGREFRYANAYVILSPGSFSDVSIRSMDSSSVPWLFISSNRDRFLQEITASVFEQSDSVQVVIVPGTSHAADILETSPNMAEHIVVWLCQRLQLADAVEN